MKKTQTIHIKVTKDEKKQFEEHAKARGMNVSSYLMALHNGIISNKEKLWIEK